MQDGPYTDSQRDAVAQANSLSFANATPTPEMLDHDPLFEAIWGVIKSWDVNVPGAYRGYCGANGNHVVMIYNAITNQRGLALSRTGETQCKELSAKLKGPKIYKHVDGQPGPTRCEECDSECFITSGGMNLVCYHCWLESKIEALESSLSRIKEALMELRTDILSGTGTREMTAVELQAIRTIEAALASSVSPQTEKEKS